MQHAVLALLSATPTPTPILTTPPTPSPSVTNAISELGNQATTAAATVVCSRDDITICGLVFRFTGDKRLGQLLQVLLGTPLQILVIVLLGLLTRRLLHRLIDRLADRLSRPQHVGGLSEIGERISEHWSDRDDRPADGHETADQARERQRQSVAATATRREARARTLASVLRSMTTAVIGIVVLLSVLPEIGIPITGLLASAGVLGVAVGFGSQSLVRDVVSGMFMIIEDQYGVGDWIDVGDAYGRVEAVGLRISRLRDIDGTVWYVRNGEIQRVGNKSQGWARVVIDIPVVYGEDLERAQQVMREVAAGFWADPQTGALALAEPEVWGVEKLYSDAVLIRVVARTHPRNQWRVARLLRERLKTALEAEGVTLAAQPWAMAQEHAAPADAPQGERDSEGEHRARSSDPMGS